jgi:hypothetical protein
MPSIQLRVSRHAVHTVGITENGILYIDVQSFGRSRTSRARTFYVRAADVARIKQLAAPQRSRPMSDQALLRLMAASFHSAQYALEWLRWACVPTIRCYDETACHNAEERIPQPALC